MIKRLKVQECNAAQLGQDVRDEERDSVDDGRRMKVEALELVLFEQSVQRRRCRVKE